MILDYRKTVFLTSAAAAHQFPKTGYPEVAVVGRSNVGKSSLLNLLTDQRGLAKVSKTPGRTQLVNFFSVEERAYLVDLPGYGFADVPESVQKQWDVLMHDYLSDREPLLGLILLLDIRREPSPHDHMMLDWTNARGLPTLAVLTKVDKMSGSESFTRMHKIAKSLGISPKRCVRSSALKREGREALAESIDALYEDYFSMQNEMKLATELIAKIEQTEGSEQEEREERDDQVAED